MATLHPFPALRPVPAKVAEVASVPYDVINTAEARTLAEGKPLSFLHVIRPEIDLPPGTDEHDDAVYAKGAENLRRFADGPHTIVEDQPALYVYRITMDGRSQTGIYGCVSVDDYDQGVILKHELTRPAKEDDRTRHLLTQQAHAEPVMLTFRDDPAIIAVMRETMQTAPLYDFTAPDGVQHTVWRVPNPTVLVSAFDGVPNLYVADGHHRCKAASRAAEALRAEGHPSSGEYAFFPAALFPMGEMHIMPYNRIIRKLPEGPEAFLKTLKAHFEVQPTEDPTPARKGAVCVYLGGQWHTFDLPQTQRGTVADALDVARLSEYLLEPLLGINDVRRDPNIDFVGGIRGTAALERLVDAGKAELAISMAATSIEELVAVSDAGLLMPPKSTWFEPKLRSGLLIHLFDN